jgi:hypothetical protein
MSIPGEARRGYSWLEGAPIHEAAAVATNLSSRRGRRQQRRNDGRRRGGGHRRTSIFANVKTD